LARDWLPSQALQGHEIKHALRYPEVVKGFTLQISRRGIIVDQEFKIIVVPGKWFLRD
jgi:hypothetical protein